MSGMKGLTNINNLDNAFSSVNSVVSNSMPFAGNAIAKIDVGLFNDAVKNSMSQYKDTSNMLTDYLKGKELTVMNEDPNFKTYLDTIKKIDEENREVYDRAIYIEVMSKVASARISLLVNMIGKGVQGIMQVLQSSS